MDVLSWLVALVIGFFILKLVFKVVKKTFVVVLIIGLLILGGWFLTGGSLFDSTMVNVL